MIADRYDVIVVGGGSAGCVVASRLSSDPKLRVLLVEAGPDFDPGAEPAALRDPGFRTLMLSKYFWPDLIDERGRPVTQAKLMGGGSAINGMHAQRGFPSDYDEWRQYGVEGWAWDDVLPYFRKLETDVDFGGEMHGADGPIVLQRVPERSWSRLTLAFREALEKRGLPRLADINAEVGDGTAPTPISATAQSRSSSAAAYLTAEVRGRPNLDIRANTSVRRVILKDARATSVEIDKGSVVAAENVIVCSGAIHSPSLLLRSGIGPARELRDAGVAVVMDRPGVGRNLINHPFLIISSFIKKLGRQREFRRVRPAVPMLVRYSSKTAGEPTDMALIIWERVPGPLEDDPLGRQLAQTSLVLYRSHSRGVVRLDPNLSAAAPRIESNVLGDPRDMARVIEGFHFVCELLGDAPVAELIGESFVANRMMGIPPDPLTAALLQDNRRAHLISAMGAWAMDRLPGARSHFLGKAGRSVGSILAEPDKLESFVRRIAVVGGHPAGTCRMGSLQDPGTVVDSRCRVIGVQGLWVADASIFPAPLRAGTNIPTIMAAEKCSDMIRRDMKERSW